METKDAMRGKILSQVKEYCEAYHKPKEFTPGDRIGYAGRVYDHEEMVNLVDRAWGDGQA